MVYGTIPCKSTPRDALASYPRSHCQCVQDFCAYITEKLHTENRVPFFWHGGRTHARTLYTLMWIGLSRNSRRPNGIWDHIIWKQNLLRIWYFKLGFDLIRNASNATKATNPMDACNWRKPHSDRKSMIGPVAFVALRTLPALHWMKTMYRDIPVTLDASIVFVTYLRTYILIYLLTITYFTVQRVKWFKLLQASNSKAGSRCLHDKLLKSKLSCVCWD